MFIVNVNGKDYQSDTDLILMDFLREELKITSVKNGCREGACGTCTVIIEGKTARACIQKLSNIRGKKDPNNRGIYRERKTSIWLCFRG